MFEVEVGQYLKKISPQNPIGICEQCLTMRTRDEVKLLGKGASCPASVVSGQWYDAPAEHAWKGFTRRGDLEAYLKENFGRYRDLLGAVDAWVLQQADGDS